MSKNLTTSPYWVVHREHNDRLAHERALNDQVEQLQVKLESSERELRESNTSTRNAQQALDQSKMELDRTETKLAATGGTVSILQQCRTHVLQQDLGQLAEAMKFRIPVIECIPPESLQEATERATNDICTLIKALLVRCSKLTTNTTQLGERRMKDANQADAVQEELHDLQIQLSQLQDLAITVTDFAATWTCRH
ncbi:hypothetical protein OPT61_g3119 [Boeremia exigua]|uniref:Uncharacterized protein n=1 Tax=Boeremia exigua TaxID=749465 RepID=A0ACC2IJ24_9PLEO|nr:hypothetical protein OPT61_g3119 [Boeremia exigua]